MGNLYRKDILDKAGITAPPTTWDQYATDAATVKEKTGSTCRTSPPARRVRCSRPPWQAGVKPFGYDGEEGGDDRRSTARGQEGRAPYWPDLIQKDTDLHRSGLHRTSWYQGLANGKYARLADRGVGSESPPGSTAKDTSGLWRAAELPQTPGTKPALGQLGRVAPRMRS